MMDVPWQAYLAVRKGKNWYMQLDFYMVTF